MIKKSCHNLIRQFQIFDLGSKIILALFFFIILNLLSCDVAAKNNTVLSGTYTVGTGGDFTTLTEAINTYNTSSLNGHVLFVLTNETYSTEETFPLIIKTNSSASAITTLTIKPAANVTVIISGAVSNGALIRVLGDYIYIDGSNNQTQSRDLTITNTSIIQPRVILFGSVGTNAVSYCGIKNCNLINGISDRSVLLVSDTTMTNPPSAGYFSNITIENNSFKRAIYGIYCNAVPVSLNGAGLNFISNELSNSGTSDSIQQYGIYLEGTDGVLIKGNKIGNFKRLDSVSDKGIYISYGVKNTRIIGNSIFNINNTANKGCGAHGIYIGSGILNANITVANNMIANISADGNDQASATYNLENPAGILLSSGTSQSGINIYHNSIFLGGVAGFTNTLNKPGAVSACIRLKSGSSADIRNNILINNLGLKDSVGFGATAIMVSSNASQLTQLNYNDYAVNPTGRGIKLFGYIYSTGTRAATMAAWRSATSKDGASVNIIPQFQSSTDLHLLNSSNTVLNNLGTTISGYDYDFDSTSRNMISPDMGCDEFVPSNTANWVGKYSTDWNDITNWEANVKPNENIDIIMSLGSPFFPYITDTTSVRNINLSGTSNSILISLDSSAVFQVNGTITKNNGYIDASDGIFCLNGSLNQSIPTNLFLDNKVLNLKIGNSNLSGVSLLGPVDIYKALNFSDSGYKLNTNGYLTLKSSEIETASVGNLTGKIINGDVTVERFIPVGVTHAKSWQFLSVPVNGAQTINQAWQDSATSYTQNRYPGFGTTITSNLGTNTVGCNALGFDFFTPAGGTLKSYNAADSSWVGVASTHIPIANKKGYFVFVRGDRSVITSSAAPVPTVLRAKGKLYTAASGELPPVSTVVANRFESIGNPYASAIDFRYINIAGNNVDNTFYVWDPLLAGSYNLGGFQTISSVNGFRPIPGGTANYNNAIPCTTIQSGQAFFVHATGPNSGGSISFDESVKTTGSKTTFRHENLNTPQNFIHTLLFTATGNNDKLADGNIIVLDNNENNEYDSRDALKILNSGENFSINSCSKKLSVESRAMPVAGDTFHFVMNNMKKQNYQLRIAAAGLVSNDFVMMLLDKYNNAETIISNEDTTIYEFNVNDNAMSSASDRFKIVFKTIAALPVTFVSVNAIPLQNGSKRIIWQIANPININSYQIERSKDGINFSVIGNVASTVMLNYEFIDEGKESGKLFYRIKAVENGGHYYLSKIVAIDNAIKNQFSIYPNPVEGHVLHLHFGKSIPVGNYTWKIVNQSGQIIQKGDLLVGNRTAEISLLLKTSILQGDYNLILSDNKTIKETLPFILL